jgi:hypothetical protein
MKAPAQAMAEQLYGKNDEGIADVFSPIDVEVH